jgi:sulfatase maturation enzyme AslB (radical SAM superfamily)
MASPERIERLMLVLTSQCNLRCGYCFQNDKKPGRMEWDTLRGAIDLALRSDRPTIELYFFGGEPLLEFPLVRRAVRYASSRRPRGRRLKFGIITNGLLLTPQVAAFLAAHRFETQISFDGVPEAQEIRGRGTHRVLDETLVRLRRDHPRFFAKIAVTSTVTPATVRHMADSVAYFLARGVRDLTLSPSITHDGGWPRERIVELREQFDRILAISLDHFRATGTTPLSVFRGGTADDLCHESSETMCGVMAGTTPAVDVDGTVHGCVMFADSFQKWPSPFMRARTRQMRIGDYRSAEFRERYAAFPAAVARAGLFHGKHDKHSGYRRCADCEYVTRCTICPVSIGNIPGNEDPHRVPDFGCAYNMVSLEFRDRFRRAARPIDPVRRPPRVSAGSRRILELARAARER